MNTSTKFEVKATAPNGDVFEMDFELPGALTSEQWDSTKDKFQQFLDMVTPMASDEEAIATSADTEQVAEAA